jgi:AcrR family transcriptional regulator
MQEPSGGFINKRLQERQVARRSPGRPRSETVRQSLLIAFKKLILRDGYRHMTIESVADEARVSRTTVYRWYKSKADIALDALTELSSQVPAVEDQGSFEADLIMFMQPTFAAMRENRLLFGGVVADAQSDPLVAEALRDRFILLRMSVFRIIFDRAAQRGEIHKGIEIEFVRDLVYGPAWYRMLLGHAALDVAFANQLVIAVVKSCAA